jgi:hypothetical protein
MKYLLDQGYEVGLNNSQIVKPDEKTITRISDYLLGTAGPTLKQPRVTFTKRRSGMGTIALNIAAGAQCSDMQTITTIGNKKDKGWKDILAYQKAFFHLMPFLRHSSDKHLKRLNDNSLGTYVSLYDDVLATSVSITGLLISQRATYDSASGIGETSDQTIAGYHFGIAIGTLQGILLTLAEAEMSKAATILDVGAIATGLTPPTAKGEGKGYIYNTDQVPLLKKLGVYTCSDVGAHAVIPEIPQDVYDATIEQNPWAAITNDGYFKPNGEGQIQTAIKNEDTNSNRLVILFPNGGYMIGRFLQQIHAGFLPNTVYMRAKRISNNDTSAVVYKGMALLEQIVENLQSKN